jgi:molecular chaperone GrpE (heat shock protein)
LRLWKTIQALVLGSVLAPALLWAAGDAVREKIEKPVQQAIDTRQATQQAEEAWRQERDERMALLASLEQAQARLEQAQLRLQEDQAARRQRIEAKSRQLAASEEIAGQIIPYLEEVLAALRARIDVDQPFLTRERRLRVDRLGNLLGDPGVTVSEKFRKTMEALMVEAEYGRTIEVYQDTITVAGQPLLATIFRLGRIALFYQTLDQRHSGMFDVAAKAWTPLPSSFDRTLRTAIEIGAKRQPVELLNLPLGRMATP